MFKLDSEEALLATFRPKDRKLVELAPETRFPLIVRGYHAWVHPAGGRVFLVFAVPGGAPIGIAFDGNGSGPSVPHMCDWCHCSGSGTEVAMLTTFVHSRKRVGVQVCSDLSCKRKLEEEADRTGKNAKRAIEQLVARMGRFASEALKIDLSGAGR
jgi:hypothetical protein